MHNQQEMIKMDYQSMAVTLLDKVGLPEGGYDDAVVDYVARSFELTYRMGETAGVKQAKELFIKEMSHGLEQIQSTNISDGDTDRFVSQDLPLLCVGSAVLHTRGSCNSR